ncbi:MAG TPA: uroporphyrinogen decarboxylase family protein, partial [Rhabdochlamydiaceae bacterium]
AKYLKEMIAALSVPTIVFCRGSSHLASDLVQLKPAAISFDWQRPLHEIRKEVPSHIAVQGNLDPEILKMSSEIVEKETLALLDSMRGDKGFIANLGHGVLPGTPVENVKLFVSLIQSTATTISP